jgi:hypothetical protein
MSKLLFAGRPYTIFDASNRKHRQWFAEFQENGSWGQCPVRFVIEEHGALVPVIQRQLIEYYTNREFGKVSAIAA